LPPLVNQEEISTECGKMFGRYPILLFCLLFVLVPVAGWAKMVSIAENEANLRSGPSEENEVMWVLGKGFPLQVIKSQGEWLKVRDFENDEGWVYAPLTGATPHMIVKSKLANIRSGPGENYKLTGQARYGVVFRILESTKHWIKVQHESGKTGWVARKLLWGW
jgi:SH3-like domain-containing protein